MTLEGCLPLFDDGATPFGLQQVHKRGILSRKAMAKSKKSQKDQNLEKESSKNVAKLRNADGNRTIENSNKQVKVSNYTANPSTSSSSSLAMLSFRAVVAICSLSLGLLTPFIWDLYQEQLHIYKLVLLEDTTVDVGSRHLSATKSDTPENDGTCQNEDIVYPATIYSCDEGTLSNYLHEEAVPGLHIACFQRRKDKSSAKLTLYKGAKEQHAGSPIVVSVEESQNLTWLWLKQQLVSNLGLRPADHLHQPWAIFSPDGTERLRDEESDEQESIEDLAEFGMFLVFEGGQWIWPGVRKGFQRTIRLEPGRNATLETLSLYPLVLSVDGFLSQQECDYIQEVAAPTLRYSEVTLMDHDKGRPSSDFRTSQSTFLPATNDATLTSIDDRTASLVRVPKTHQEHAQVLRYGYSEKYDAHHDYFNPKLYQRDPGTMRQIGNGKWNRMATVFWYLSDVAKGGETNFPRYDRAPQPRDMAVCDSGLKVKPVRGKVIIFYSLTPDGELDPYSLHGACPVEVGIKHAANKWIWNTAQPFVK